MHHAHATGYTLAGLAYTVETMRFPFWPRIAARIGPDRLLIVQ